MWRNTRKWLVLILILPTLSLISAGCLQTLYPKPGVVSPSTTQAPPEAPVAAQPDEYTLLAEAQKAQAKGQHASALSQYEAFLSRYPESTYRPSALVAVGQIRENLGRTNEAIAAYRELLVNYPNSRFRNQAALRLAELYLRNRQYDLAIPLIDQQIKTAADANQGAHWQLLSAKAQHGLGNRIGALKGFLAAYRQTIDPIDKNEARRGVRVTILAMDAEDLAQAKTGFPPGFPSDYLTYILAYRYYEQGRFEEARAQADEYLRTYPNNENASDAQALIRAMDGLGPPPKLAAITDFDKPGLGGLNPPQSPIQTGPPQMGGPSLDVACLLPLSDNQWSEFGQRVRKGLELAFNSYRSPESELPSQARSLRYQGRSGQDGAVRGGSRFLVQHRGCGGSSFK